MGNTQEYFLFLVLDQPMTEGYLSNKHLVDGGDLIYLDGLTTRFENAQEIGDATNHTNNKVYFSNAIQIPKKEGEKILKKEQEYPQKIEKVLFYKHNDFIHKLFETGENPNNYIDTLIQEYKDYLWNHKSEIKNSLVRFVKIPGLTIDASINYDDFDKIFYSYYYKKDITYNKIRDTYLELCRFYPNRLKTNKEESSNIHK